MNKLLPKDEVREIAVALHDWYEQSADIFQWETQKACQVPFDELPENNRLTMYHVAEQIYNKLIKPEYAKGKADTLEAVERVLEKTFPVLDNTAPDEDSRDYGVEVVIMIREEIKKELKSEAKEKGDENG